MSTTITIRHAQPGDYETIAEYNVALAAETEDFHLDPAVVREGVQAILNDPSKGTYFVAERDGRVVGQLMITYEWSDWRNGQIWWIQSVYVAPDARGAKVYRQLHQHVEREARATSGVVAIRLYVHHDNTRAQDTYSRLGMQRTEYQIFETDWSSVQP